MRDERVTRILNDLTSLIVDHAGMTAIEQYRPTLNPDDSDDHIRQHKAWVKELREIRERVENLFTGIL